MLVLTYAAELFSTCAHVLKEEEWCMQWVTIIDQEVDRFIITLYETSDTNSYDSEDTGQGDKVTE